MSLRTFVAGLQWPGRIVLGIAIAVAIFGGKWAYGKWVPKKAKEVNVTTKASLPPLAYDKSANAPIRALPSFNEPVEVNAPEIRGEVMGWNAQSGLLYAVGGSQTSAGSICQELGLNVKVNVQNNCAQQGNDLYAFAEEFHGGNANPTKGCHFIAWMGDGVPSYLAGLNDRLKKDFGAEYQAKVITFGGASYGEDKWLLKKKYAKDPRGSLTVAVIRDGDWNSAKMKCDLIGCPVNYDNSTYDPTKANFIAAPNDDYMEAVKVYVTGQKVTLKLVKNGKVTDKDTTLTVTGVATWFPGDADAVVNKGGLITMASTKDFPTQMANAIIFIDKWAQDNRPAMEKFCEAVGRGGDQVKSHDEALVFASKVSELVYADKTKTADDWYKAYLSYNTTDEDGNEISIGGSRVFNLADAAYYTGVSGGQDKYRTVYTTFGNICKEAYPEILSSYPAYEDATDWSYLKAAYAKNKAAGTTGNASKVDFKQATSTGEVIGDAAYNIEFKTGSAEILASSYPVLDRVVGQLGTASNTFVELTGYTDNVGEDASNLALSKRRADAVRIYLIAKGDEDSDDRIKPAKGLGEANPVASNETDAGRAKNRRVEIKLVRVKQ